MPKVPPLRRRGTLVLLYSLWTKPTVAWTHEGATLTSDFIEEARAWALSKGYSGVKVTHPKPEEPKPVEEKPRGLPPLKRIPAPRIVSVE